MRGDRGRRRPGGSLSTPPPRPTTNWDLPSDYRGKVLTGEDAARRASLVSGPFRAAPPAFLVPADADSLRHIVRLADTRGWPLIPRGAGTGMPGGNLGPHAVVEIGSGFDDLEWIDPEAGLLRVGAGAVAADVDRFARTRGWFLPFLPSSAPWCRVGGMVANNAAGARSFRFGPAASSVEAIEGILASGELFRTGPDATPPSAFESLRATLTERLMDPGSDGVRGWPDVRKNASGYALDRFLAAGDPAQLLVGSEGTLALITRVDLRLTRVPESVGLAVLPAQSSEALAAIALEARGLGATTCEFLGRRFLEVAGLERDPEVGETARTARALVLVEVSGSPDVVRNRLARISEFGRQLSGAGITADQPAAVKRLWSIRHAASPIIAREAGRGRISTQFIEDSVVPPARLTAYLEGIEEILSDARFDAIVFGHAGDGNVHVNPLLDVDAEDCLPRARRVLEQVTDLVAELGGTLSGEHGDGRLRTPLRDRVWPGHLVRAFDEVKERLDPRGILNPGVIRPVEGQDPFDAFAPRPRSHPA